MAMNEKKLKVETTLKEFLSNFQKDLNTLQKSVKKESEDLVQKLKTAANKDSVQAKRKELEQMVEKKLKKFEPTINKFVHELNVSAKKAGVDLTELEKKVRTNLQTARTRLSKAGTEVKAKAKKRTARKAPAKKQGATLKRKTEAKATVVTEAPASDAK